MEKALILVVDDNPVNINVLSTILRPDYNVKMATRGEKALEIANQANKPDLILLDIMMPEMDGYEVIARLKNNPKTSNIPVIFVTAKISVEDETRGLDLGAVDYIAKPINASLVQARVRTHLALYNQSLELFRQVTEKTQEINQTRLSVIQRLGRSAEYKDNETGMHVLRMSHYSQAIALAMGLDKIWCDRLLNASPMHDLGKIGIEDAILKKPGKLDGDEWETMKQHPRFGADILSGDESELMRMAHDIALTHHEKWDGSGYPQGLKGEEIPLSARIVAVADVFDALTTARPYKEAWSIEKACSVISQDAGTHFDPDVVEVFESIMDKILELRARFPELKT
ncbi:two-component system response regulator [Alginatibacterium sediminis]|uniref:Two-component system response regulator n=1 Tax=Alginatibacterium sediminis TaxID=2164068 RepID=A0A420EKW2_9ALTE|nr:two-component system response regulator [Alginatibacterium sediminis]RKF21335.1 two-component system response regulator [Alginatibacterium sediminis]